MSTSVDTSTTAIDTMLFGVVPEIACDSIAADTAACSTVMAEVATVDSSANGLEPMARNYDAAHNNLGVAAVAVMVLALIFNYGNLRRLRGVFCADLIKVRRTRDNFSDDLPSYYPGLQIWLMLQCVAAIALTAGALAPGADIVFGAIAIDLTLAIAAVVAIWIVVEYGVYQLLGYTFGSGDDRRQLVQSYVASLVICGVLLPVPAAVAVFYPACAGDCLIAVGAIYGVCRILFIRKGLRIFYSDYISLIYFILYLCTMEIAPVISACKLIRLLASAMPASM